MEDLLFAINSLFPIILLIGLGYIIKRTKLISKEVFGSFNKLCFRVLLPVSLFVSIYESSDIKDFNLTLILFITLSLITLFFIGLAIVKIFIKDDRQKGVILQGIFRSNYAIIGIPLATAIGGEAATKVAAIVALVTIPIFNILGTIALTIFVRNADKISIKKTFISIITNPLILGVLSGIFALLVRLLLVNLEVNFRLDQITFVYKALTSVSVIASPLALITLGGLFEFASMKGLQKTITFTVLTRLVILPLIVFSITFLLFDFSSAEYATLISVYASPIAVSSAVMAKEMHNDGELANQIVVWTTIFSSISLFLIIYLFRILEVF
jgi:predicted permease